MSLLKVEDLSKSFGGVQAVSALNLAIEAGAIHSIIGPNGAGKTTLFNLVTGVYRPTGGRILFDGETTAGCTPSDLARRGISRTFQNLQIFFNMTALENVLVGFHLRLNTGFLAALLSLPEIRRQDARRRKDAAELLDFVGLADYRRAESASMPYGALKRLEIARALASEPRLLLLDEPAAGLNPAETQSMDRLITEIARRGVTVVLVEHDMRLVMGVSDHILVLDQGRTLAEGNAEEIRHNKAVIKAYLGTGVEGTS